MIFTSLLSFAFSPIGRWLAGAAAIIAVLLSLGLYFDHKGASRIQAKWDAANRAAALAAQRRDEQAKVIVDTSSATKLSEIEKQLAETAKERDAYADQVEASKDAARKCVLDDGLRDRLRVPRNPAARR